MTSLAAAGRRGLLDRVLARRLLLGLEGELDPARLEVVESVFVRVLDERGAVVEVAGVAELQGRRALAGVVALVGDLEVRLQVLALGFLAEPTGNLRYSGDGSHHSQRQYRGQYDQFLQDVPPSCG